MINKLHSIIAAANLPVVGVAIGDINDRSTWRADLDNGTAQQQVEAQAIINAFDLNAAMVEEAADDARKSVDATEAASVKADNQVQTFLNFTPANLDNWITNNITAATTLDELKTATATALGVLGRTALAAGRGKVLR